MTGERNLESTGRENLAEGSERRRQVREGCSGSLGRGNTQAGEGRDLPITDSVATPGLS